MADNMAEVQGPQSIHNSHGHIDHLQQANLNIASINSEMQKLWRTLESQSKKYSQGNRGFCCYHERFAIKATKYREYAPLRLVRETTRPVDERSPHDWEVFSS